jgi:hypothetical protein
VAYIRAERVYFQHYLRNIVACIDILQYIFSYEDMCRKFRLIRKSLVLTRNNSALFYVGVDWIELAQSRDQWQDLVNTVMNLGIPVKYGDFLD